MLTASFCCFHGLSSAAERSLWHRGCLNWKLFQHLPAKTFSPRKHAAVHREISAARAALAGELADFFLHRLSGTDKVRTLHGFRDRAAFVDIETTGLSASDYITTIAVFAHNCLSVFTQGVDLAQFLATLADIKLIVTYNGGRFDLPFLRRHFAVDLGIPHLDLMPVLAGLGFKGGQKRCEQQLGLERSCSAGRDGAEAVRLWHRYQHNSDREALRNLIIYNAEDVVMLERLAVMAYNQSMAPYPLDVRMVSRIPVEWASNLLRTSAL